MNTRIGLVTVFAFAVAGLIAIPRLGFGQGIQANAAAVRPLQITGLLSGHTPVYYKNRNRYHKLAYHSGQRIFNKFTAIRFKNTGDRVIAKITFELIAYDDVYHPIRGASGKPVIKNMVASGALAPGATRTLVNANTVWAVPANYLLGCVLMSGISVVYADGATVTIPEADVNEYFLASLSNQCGIPAGSAGSGPRTFTTGPSPYIAGVYPARWMVQRDYHLLYRQPFVAPGDTQPLCAPGSMLEEYCVAGPGNGNLPE